MDEIINSSTYDSVLTENTQMSGRMLKRDYV